MSLLKDVSRAARGLLSEDEEPSGLTGVFIQGSLKPNLDDSTTYRVSQIIEREMPEVQFQHLHLAAMHLDASTEATSQSDQDQIEDVIKAITNADVVIFTTPIWWGTESSLVQKVIERLDGLDYRCYDSEDKPSIGENKVFGVIVSGDSDGVQACVHRLNGWATMLGFTCSPYNAVGYLASQFKSVDAFTKGNRCYNKMMAKGLTKVATLLSNNPF